MRKSLLFVLFLALLAPSPGRCEGVDMDALQELAARFPFALVVKEGGGEQIRFIYSDVVQHVHIYHIEKGKLVLDWETTNLGSKVTALFMHDLFNDGRKELIIATEAGRILIYDAESYDLLWENLQDPFEKIECMTAGNIDHDPQEELIFIADSYLYIYDSVNKSLEWQSQKQMHAKEILLANIDDDEQLEIILNTGIILDSRFYNIEYEVDSSFGERISLFDINSDGIPEIFGEFSDFTLRVYDIYAEREIW
jgi:hypothetical protein